MLQRRHYVLIAAALREALDIAESSAQTDKPALVAGVVMAIDTVTEACAGKYDNFDEDRFRKACGLSGMERIPGLEEG